MSQLFLKLIVAFILWSNALPPIEKIFSRRCFKQRRGKVLTDIAIVALGSTNSDIIDRPLEPTFADINQRFGGAFWVWLFEPLGITDWAIMSEKIDVVRALALERLVSSVETLGAFVVDNIS